MAEFVLLHAAVMIWAPTCEVPVAPRHRPLPALWIGPYPGYTWLALQYQLCSADPLQGDAAIAPPPFKTASRHNDMLASLTITAGDASDATEV